MKEPVFYAPGNIAPVECAKALLKEKGFRFSQEPTLAVTHLLLPAPSFTPEGSLKCGGHPEEILSTLSADVQIIGGNLNHPAIDPYEKIDLLKDPDYVAENAQITAHCAVRLIMQKLPVILSQCPILVIGWGRIGKCLAKLLCDMGAFVTVAAHKESDRAILHALGYDAIDTVGLSNSLARFRAILNTAPVDLLTKEDFIDCRKDCLKIDLASYCGIEGDDVIWARGLPGKDAPESSGTLIAKTILRKGVWT